MNKLHIITHNGTFHADECLAIALLKTFNDTSDYFEVERINHQDPIPSHADFVIDIGSQYDGKKFFDHHQYQASIDNPNEIGNKSSAGLIWEYLSLGSKYPEISKLVKAVDDNDVGIKPAAEFEFSRLVSMYNTADIYSDGQGIAFHSAILWIMEILTNMKEAQHRINTSKTICDNAPELIPGVLDIGRWQLGWTKFINSKTRPDIEAVVWYDTHKNTYNIQTTNKSPDTYEKVGRQLYPCDTMDFVHSNNFFAVASSKLILLKYLETNFK